MCYSDLFKAKKRKANLHFLDMTASIIFKAADADFCFRGVFTANLTWLTLRKKNSHLSRARCRGQIPMLSLLPVYNIVKGRSSLPSIFSTVLSLTSSSAGGAIAPRCAVIFLHFLIFIFSAGLALYERSVSYTHPGV